MPYYIAIAAISKNRAIGKGGKIPWHIPEDFKHFKETTFGHPIIMGRKTYESIGRPLPGRENIVLTRGEYQADGVTVLHSIADIEEYLKEKEQVFICGGGAIYTLFFEHGLTNEVILSRIDRDIDDADAFFPEFEKDFTRIRNEEKDEFTIEYWKRKS